MSQNGLPDEMSNLVVNAGEEIWVNLYPNALSNVKRALKAHLDERIGKFCNINNGIFLSYTDLKFRAKHFQVFEDYPICRFPVSITATYYKPEPGTIATGTITRVDHISVTCLIHGMIHVTIALRKSVNFDSWCALGQQIVFQIRGGEMHYKGVRLNAIVTDDCVDRMRVAFPPPTIGARKRTFSSSSADSTLATPQKQTQPSVKRNLISSGKLAKSNNNRKADYVEHNDQLDDAVNPYDLDPYESEVDYSQELLGFGTPEFTSTQIRQNKKPKYYNFDDVDNEDKEFSVPTPDDDASPAAKRIKVEYSAQEEATPFQISKSQRKLRKKKYMSLTSISASESLTN
ncbi:hypothetical protein BIW11_13112 [Tropilaelaps mercedesae]|uniref:DNA-directed RNA polymerase I subunit RPA43-like n=1 Tax=Tropilaelaps mercedesae TaxID=418985 RepID=A0A1V9X3A9_9ACAR|nr:hypothetical protein BIW11_13112 [Tropilaelaps mercedesae]